MFGEISPRYDLLNHVLSGGIDILWRRRTVRAAGAVDGPVLDVCTGTGDLALAFWKKTRGSVPVVGADFTHEMLLRAVQKSGRRRSRWPGREAAAFVLADAQRLPFADKSFAVVSVAFGLRNVADTDRGLAEMARVCRPGGRVLVLEFSMPKNRIIGGLYRFYFRYILPRIGQLLARNRQAAYEYLPQSVAEFPQGEALAARMRAAGFEPVTWRSLTFGIATLYCGIKPAESRVEDRESRAGAAATPSAPAPSMPPNSDSSGPRLSTLDSRPSGP
ncbi:MAG: class I SAM-dependent methyltransferase [Planctomycetes bacterium]|nr:class I SAM-dependent methyltransferase [Planctomycetota bacterium]